MSSIASQPRKGPEVQLLVLSGMQAGARSVLALGTHLLGNKPGCDVMIELDATEMIVVRLEVAARKVGVTLLEGHAELGVGALQCHRRLTIRHDEMLRLGTVGLRLTFAPEAQVIGRRPSRSQGKLRLIAGGFASAFVALGLIMALAVVIPPPGGAVAGQLESGATPDRVAAKLAQLGYGQLKISVLNRGELVVEGTVPTTADVTRLTTELKQLQPAPKLKISVAGEMYSAAGRSLEELSGVTRVWSVKPGVLAVELEMAAVSRATAAARQLLAYDASVVEVRLLPRDLVAVDAAASAPPPVLSLTRRTDGSIIASDDWPMGATPIDVSGSISDVRQGELPSIVLRNGTRLFEGGRLPDGSYIARIDGNQIVVRHGNFQRIVNLDAFTVAGPTPSGV